MGLYDNVVGHVRCPYCSGINEIDEQIKFTDEPCLRSYIIGDVIDAVDGEYQMATDIRQLMLRCSYCDKDFAYKIIVKNGILESFSVTTKPSQKEKVHMTEYVFEKHKLWEKYHCPDVYKIKYHENDNPKDEKDDETVPKTESGDDDLLRSGTCIRKNNSGMMYASEGK